MMKRDQYVDQALRYGYKIRDINGMTTYELSRLAKTQPLVRPMTSFSDMNRRYGTSSKLTPSEEMALKKYFKGK